MRTVAAALALLLSASGASAAEPGVAQPDATSAAEPGATMTADGTTPPPETIAITGAVHNPGAVTLQELMKMPPVDVTVTQQTDKGPVTGTFRGALLWTLVSQADPVDGPEKNAYLRHTIFVSGADGYTTALSDGEIDPKLEGKHVIVAYAKDGVAFDGLRLVVPGDAHAARGVHDIAVIEVK
ncbi:MAG: hypothetical protein JOZ72_01660 [Alphaproteobacteria bacterium]|nr:hypothetical protein [Alphaproteobacteria bacterium]